MKGKRWKPLCGESGAETKGMRVTFAFYSSWYLFAHGSHQQCPLCSQHSAPPSLQSHCARVNSSCPGQLQWKEASLGRGEPPLVSPWLSWVEFSWREGPCPWRCGRDKWDHGGEEEGVQVADTWPGWSRAGHTSCCPAPRGARRAGGEQGIVCSHENVGDFHVSRLSSALMCRDDP